MRWLLSGFVGIFVMLATGCAFVGSYSGTDRSPVIVSVNQRPCGPFAPGLHAAVGFVRGVDVEVFSVYEKAYRDSFPADGGPGPSSVALRLLTIDLFSSTDAVVVRELYPLAAMREGESVAEYIARRRGGMAFRVEGRLGDCQRTQLFLRWCTTWGGEIPESYNLATANCYDFVTDVLNDCGVGAFRVPAGFGVVGWIGS